ncbi:MAG: 4-(cytidine 5'-diphospho)-2-C-methyl-D-erythritol kinase [Defluviitaleaceae bacterium]|nr:4-(cytidine 5'-diphospho)-2-C-methyl-D-erythritol kinase [Defluviitaleaceae bacterium]
MEELIARARAKINLALDILGKRESDGYHEISTIMQTISLSDELHIKKIYKPDYLKLVTNIGWLATDERNLAYQAAEYLKTKYGIEEGIFIELHKVIPASAGMGGGSADCAAVLKGVRDLFKLPLTDEDLMRLGAKFGADVPFCVMGGTALATGIGEVLRPLPRLPICHIVVIKPPSIVSTQEVFSEFDLSKVAKRPDMEKILHYFHKQDLDGIAANMANALESVTEVKLPIISEIKEFLKAKGALGAMMTGSGPTVFAIFRSRGDAINAAKLAKEQYPDINEIFLTKPVK